VESKKLLSCPFCGGKADLQPMLYNIESLSLPVVYWSMQCKDCPCSIGDQYESEAEAIAAWNKRAGDTNDHD